MITLKNGVCLSILLLFISISTYSQSSSVEIEPLVRWSFDESSGIRLVLANLQEKPTMVRIFDDQGDLLWLEKVKNESSNVLKFDFTELVDGEYQFVIRQKGFEKIMPMYIYGDHWIVVQDREPSIPNSFKDSVVSEN